MGPAHTLPAGLIRAPVGRDILTPQKPFPVQNTVREHLYFPPSACVGVCRAGREERFSSSSDQREEELQT